MSRIIELTDTTTFLSELAILLTGGISLQNALEVLRQDQEKSTMQRLVAALSKNVQQGEKLSTSLAHHPSYFEPFLVEIIQQDEQQGELVTGLTKVVAYRESLEGETYEIGKRMASAAVYPVALLIIVFVMALGLLVFVVPVFADLFRGFGADLPALTAWIVRLSDFVTTYWWILFAVLLVIVGAADIARRRGTLLLRMPILNRLFRKVILIRFLRTYTFMISNGATPAKALQACAQAVQSAVYAKVLQQMSEQVATGKSLAEVFAQQSLFPAKIKMAMTVSMKQSEQQNRLFNRLADIYTVQLQRTVAPTFKLFSIAALVTVGLLVGILVVAMYLPIFKMGAIM